MFKQGIQGASLHNLAMLFKRIPSLQRTISLDRTGRYKDAWNILLNYGLMTSCDIATS